MRVVQVHGAAAGHQEDVAHAPVRQHLDNVVGELYHCESLFQSSVCLGPVAVRRTIAFQGNRRTLGPAPGGREPWRAHSGAAER